MAVLYWSHVLLTDRPDSVITRNFEHPHAPLNGFTSACFQPFCSNPCLDLVISLPVLIASNLISILPLHTQQLSSETSFISAMAEEDTTVGYPYLSITTQNRDAYLVVDNASYTENDS